MSQPVEAVYYFTVPDDLQIDPGLGFTTTKMNERGEQVVTSGGSMSFFFFFAKLMLPPLAALKREEQEEFLTSRLLGVKGGAKIEIPAAHFPTLLECLPGEALAQQVPELYFAVRPFIRAVRLTSTTKPAGWDLPAIDTTAPPAVAA